MNLFFLFKGPIGPQGPQGEVGQKGERGEVRILSFMLIFHCIRLYL
jgi:hypothetical protein